MTEVAYVSWNENGFWQANYWLDVDPTELELTGQSPDAFLVCSADENSEDAMHQAGEAWPNAEVHLLENEDDEGEAD